jgi:hypothetical protein
VPASTFQLVALRVVSSTLCRIPPFSRWFRRFLVSRLITGKTGRDRYVASSAFFDWSELDPPTPPSPRMSPLPRARPPR